LSSIKLTPNASGTGAFTIAAPNSNTDRTLTLPDATGTVAVSGQPIDATTGSFSGNVTLGSSVLATPTGSAPSYTCRAWVNFNGGATVSVRASGNVSSVTRFASGNYSINFTTAMPDANYATSLTGGFGQLADNNFAFGGLSRRTLSTASAATVVLWNRVNNDIADADYVTVAIFR
jgi:hypothetical protein